DLGGGAAVQGARGEDGERRVDAPGARVPVNRCRARRNDFGSAPGEARLTHAPANPAPSSGRRAGIRAPVPIPRDSPALPPRAQVQSTNGGSVRPLDQALRVVQRPPAPARSGRGRGASVPLLARRARAGGGVDPESGPGGDDVSLRPRTRASTDPHRRNPTRAPFATRAGGPQPTRSARASREARRS